MVMVKLSVNFSKKNKKTSPLKLSKLSCPVRSGDPSGQTWIGLTGQGPPGQNRQYGGQGGAGSSGGHGSAGSSGGHGRWSFVAVASVPSARLLQPEPFYPPPKKSMGQLRGIRSPPGLNKQEQDSPQEQGTGRPSWAKLGS